MHGLCVKHVQLHNKSISIDLARRLLEDPSQGKVVIVVEYPLHMFSSVRKQWLRQLRKLQIERARTLKAVRILAITEKLAKAQGLKFTANKPTEFLEADVNFATADALATVAPFCRTMYVTYNFPKEKLHFMTSWMPKDGVVVIYDQS